MGKKQVHFFGPSIFEYIIFIQKELHKWLRRYVLDEQKYNFKTCFKGL
jgi:hypothetical protein